MFILLEALHSVVIDQCEECITHAHTTAILYIVYYGRVSLLFHLLHEHWHPYHH